MPSPQSSKEGNSKSSLKKPKPAGKSVIKYIIKTLYHYHINHCRLFFLPELFFDFPPLPSRNGCFLQFKRIMEAISGQEEIIIEQVQLSQQSPLIRKYAKGKLIGRGGFANCFQGTDLQNNQNVAIKVIEKKNLLRNRAKQKLLSEIKIHKMLNHRHIVKFLTVFEDVKRVFIIVQLCSNGALSDFVRRRKRLSSIEVKRFMIQLLGAIEHLHTMRIIHRDLKMANIFLDQEMSIKVGDLGLATKLEFHDQRKRTMCGTPNYIAPEILTGGGGHSYEVDIWSTGVICYAMMYGRPPFESSEITKTYEKIKYGLFDFPQIQGVTPEFKDFISKALVVDPKKRMTLNQMKKHPFLNISLPPITYNKITLTPVYDYLFGTCKPLPHQEENIMSDGKERQKDKQSTDLSIQEKFKTIKKGSELVRQQKWNSVTVVCYVDYSTKYGLGYVLSNGVYGVYYNDSSILTFLPKKNTFFYIGNPSILEEQSKNFCKEDLQKQQSLQKKYLLMKKFQIYLEDQLKSVSLAERDIQSESSDIFIKQWLKTKHAIMFRLNNKVFQVDFFDGSQVSLKTDSKRLLIKSKKGERQETTLQQVLDQKEGELSRRIKYIREILHRTKQK